MKSRQANYYRPSSIDEAVALLGSLDSPAVLAGGQSLVAALNLRLSAPDGIVDINWIAGLDEIVETDAAVAVGALVRHRAVAESPIVARHLPLISQAMAHVAHPAIRNRGTTCGSIAYADPAAEMPACAVALDATLVLVSAAGRREVAARQFYFGLYDTDRQPDELLVEVRLPKAGAGSVTGFGEIARRHGDFASVGLAACALVTDGTITSLDAVAFASEPAPLLCEAAAQLAIGNSWTTELVEALADAVSSGIDPMDSPLGTPEMKRRQAHALARRVFGDMMRQSNEL